MEEAMIDEKLKIVLDAVEKFCSEPEDYKIIDAEDILTNIEGEVSKEELSANIKSLKERELLMVKYSTADEYCLAITAKALVEAESSSAQTTKSVATITKKNGKKAIKLPASFWGAFFGAVVGSGIVSFIVGMIQIAVH